MKRCLTTFMAANLLAVGFLAMPAAVHAQQISDAPVRLSFDVEATIAPRCGFDGAAVSSQLSTFMEGAQAGETRELQFNLSCNTPFTVRVQSRNGGLEAAVGDQEALAMMQGLGFATRMDYAVKLDVPIVDMAGNNVTEQSSCASAIDMKTGSPTCQMAKGDGVILKGTSDTAPAKLTVKLDASAQTLVAGAYSDYLTIDVGFVL